MIDYFALALLGEAEALRREVIARLPLWMVRLDERERRILCLWFGIGCKPRTLERAGAKMGIGPARAYDLKERALRRLRWYACHDYHRLDPPPAPWEERSRRARESMHTERSAMGLHSDPEA